MVGGVVSKSYARLAKCLYGAIWFSKYVADFDLYINGCGFYQLKIGCKFDQSIIIDWPSLWL